MRRIRLAALLVPRPRSDQRGQALVEFALVVALLITIVVSALAFLPAFTARGATLEAAAASLQRATAYLNSTDGTGPSDRGALCPLVYDTAYASMTGAKALGTGTLLDSTKVKATGTCADGATTSIASPFAVDLHAIGSDGRPDDSLPLAAGQLVEVCVGYRFAPAGGIWWFTTQIPTISKSGIGAVSFTYCGQDTIEANRSR